MATKKKAAKKAPAKKAPAKKAAPKKAAGSRAAAASPDVSGLLKKIEIQLGKKKITFSAKDIVNAQACLKRTGKISLVFKDITRVTPDGGTPPGPID